jgi:hypothetical protein
MNETKRFAAALFLGVFAFAGTSTANDAASDCVSSPSFHPAGCGADAGPSRRARATISNGSLIVIGMSAVDADVRPTAPATPPMIEAELRDLADQPPVRVVGPSFLPAQEAAIDLRAPGRTRGR